MCVVNPVVCNNKKLIELGPPEAKIPSEKEVAPQCKLLTLLTLLTWFTLLTLLTLFILLNLLYTAKTLTCMPIYIVRKGWNSIRRGS